MLSTPLLRDVQLEVHRSLADLTTFGLPSTAEHFVSCDSVESVCEALAWHRNSGTPLHILGGGSNVLLTGDLPGLVLHLGIAGIEEVGQEDGAVFVRVGAGVVWHDFVMAALDRGWNGLENLSLIPGSTGAGPMQNIGAYGVELEERFHSLEAVEIATGDVRTFFHADCAFGYRESVFKRGLRGQYVITQVTFRLPLEPDLRLGYGAIREELDKAGITEPTSRAVSDAVIRIRRSKLPDPAVIGNAGSFFKNPVLDAEAFAMLQAAHPDVPNYPAPNGTKVAAGWLIDKAGWKGHDRDTHGVHDRQALVLVHRGGAEGQDLVTLSEDIQADIRTRFGVDLEREVNVLPQS